MILKNKDLDNVLEALYSMGNRQPIATRWKLTKYTMPFVEASETIRVAINSIIENEGGEKKSITLDNKSYIELMNLDIEFNAEKLSLDEIALYNPTMAELNKLEKIIEE